MVNTIIVIIGAIFLALILGFFVAYLNIFISVKLKQKKIPKNMPELIKKSKEEQKEVNDARYNRDREKIEGNRERERNAKKTSGTTGNEGSTLIRAGVPLPTPSKDGRAKPTIKLHKPAALPNSSNSF